METNRLLLSYENLIKKKPQKRNNGEKNDRP